MSEAVMPGASIPGIEELEDLEAPGFWSWAAGFATGVGIGAAAAGVGVLIT